MKKIYIILALIIPSFLCASAFANKIYKIAVMDQTNRVTNQVKSDYVKLEFYQNQDKNQDNFINNGIKILPNNLMIISQTINQDHEIKGIHLTKVVRAYYFSKKNEIKHKPISCYYREPIGFSYNIGLSIKQVNFTTNLPANFGTESKPMANQEIKEYNNYKKIGNGWECINFEYR